MEAHHALSLEVVVLLHGDPTKVHARLNPYTPDTALAQHRDESHPLSKAMQGRTDQVMLARDHHTD